MSEVFSTTELRTESTRVYNSVMSNGSATIEHRDRPRMILITEDEFYRKLEDMSDQVKSFRAK